MAGFFEAADAHEIIRLGGIGIEIRVLVPGRTNEGALAVFEETTAPKAGPPLHIHHHQSEAFRVLRGAYEFIIGEDRYRAGPGDTAVIPAGVPHTFWNIGNEPGQFLFCLTPAGESEAFFRELAPYLEGEGPPDVAAINAAFKGHGFEIVGPPAAGMAGGA